MILQKHANPPCFPTLKWRGSYNLFYGVRTLPDILGAFIFFWYAAATAAAPDFPALTGRVVDEAEILSAAVETEINASLATHEQASGNQVVVVTLKSLRDYEISDYGVQLGRHWGIGQEGKNNGVLLIIAPNQREMRIEVGYGLEGLLTDAISSDIIERTLKPSFRQLNYDLGVRNGIVAILSALGGTYPSTSPSIPLAEDLDNHLDASWASFFEGIGGWSFLIPFLLPVLFFSGYFVTYSFIQRFPSRKMRLLSALVFGVFFGVVTGFLTDWLFGMLSSVVVAALTFFSGQGDGQGGESSRSSRSSSSSGSSRSSSFSGRGGSFGGGGASGRW